MPVDSMTTVVTPQATSQSAIRCKIVGESGKLLHRLLARPFRHRHKMAPGTDIDARCLRVDVLQVLGELHPLVLW